MSTIKIDRYEPDYDTNCYVCGNTPVVTMVRNNKIIYTMEKCGPCTWGEAEMLDPDEWNK